ncbi:MAG TPA: hypothetical protein VEK07_24080 [Polyangiaceae bacterium]|nr:hypothetical protein [Polyangiaceae bacterium]
MQRPIALVYAALAASLLLHVASFRDAKTGYTPLIVFGDRFAPRRLARIQSLPLYTYRNSDGYDGQFYAQVAAARSPFDPELRTALDLPAYRTGRILLPLLAHLAGLGQPAWVLTAYALSNVVCWLILAWATARWWFPPTNVDNLLRWTGTMFGAGVLTSVTRSLTDGPALLLIALGMRGLELNRRWPAALLLGAAGLVREMSALTAAACLPRSGRDAWPRALLVGGACILPAALWQATVSVHYGAMASRGVAAIGIPLVACLDKCRQVLSVYRQRGIAAVRDDACVIVALLVQVGYVIARPQPQRPWWRLAAPFALLALFLDPVPWSDAITAVPRTLLPLTLAFNVLAPRGPAGIALLVAGNLTVLSASTPLEGATATEQTTFFDRITCAYTFGWRGPEHLERRTWRWASASAGMTLHNPLTENRRIAVDFELIAPAYVVLTVRSPDLTRRFSLPESHRARVHFGPIDLPPGDTFLAFGAAHPQGTAPDSPEPSITFAVQDLRVVSDPGQ